MWFWFTTVLRNCSIPACISDDIANPLHYRREVHDTTRYSTIEVVTPCVDISMEKFEQRKKMAPKRANRGRADDGEDVFVYFYLGTEMFKNAFQTFAVMTFRLFLLSTRKGFKALHCGLFRCCWFCLF